MQQLFYKILFFKVYHFDEQWLNNTITIAYAKLFSTKFTLKFRTIATCIIHMIFEIVYAVCNFVEEY